MTNHLPRLAADTIRFLSADAVQQANSGHPGMPMGMADAAVALWTQFLRHNPADPTWVNRDRFVLSAGHGSMLLYSLLHLTGYDLPLSELQAFRQWGSATPGHPEYGHTPGVETTTGPLGQGISTAVGMALASAHLAARYNKPNLPLINHTIYVVAGDGCLQEGVASEASSLAGHWGLSNLIVLYDDNQITIDGPTHLSFTEDVLARYAAYGWHVQRVNGQDGTAVAEAIRIAHQTPNQPSLIACRTTIGYGSPNKANTAGIHGSPMGEAEIKLTKEALGWPTTAKFHIPDEVRQWLDARPAGQQAQAEWQALWETYTAQYPTEAAELRQLWARELPPHWASHLPQFEMGTKFATRNASGNVLAKLVPAIPALLGGSADLTGSNKTDVKGFSAIQKGAFDGRYLFYGVREHGMGAMMNGLALYGLIPYGGTFLVFSDYMRGAMRLAALMGTQAIYVLTHDSIGLGEDGPTHQPIEHLMSLRAMPNLWVMRPADANETAVCWQMAIERRNGPTALALTRQDLPTIMPELAAGAAQGGYVLIGSDEDDVILLATGSEVEIAVAAYHMLVVQGVTARVVSLPCWELFEAQDEAYKAAVLPPHLTKRVSIEAGVTLGWQKYVGMDGVAIGLDHFGASAPYEKLYEQFGLTAEAVATAALRLL